MLMLLFIFYTYNFFFKIKNMILCVQKIKIVFKLYIKKDALLKLQKKKKKIKYIDIEHIYYTILIIIDSNSILNFGIYNTLMITDFIFSFYEF